MEILVILGMLLISFWLLGSKKTETKRKTVRIADSGELPVIDMGSGSFTASREPESTALAPPQLQGWTQSVVTKFTPSQSWQGLTVGSVTLENGDGFFGPVPSAIVDLLKPGLVLELRYEDDDPLTCRTPDLPVDPPRVLEACLAALDATGEVREADEVPGSFSVFCDIADRAIELTAGVDGHLSIGVAITVPLGPEVIYTMDADEPYLDNPAMIGEHLWMEPDEREEAAPLVDQLSAETLGKLEQMMVASHPIVCGDDESLDFDWYLPFLDGEVAALLVAEAFEIAVAFELDARGGPVDSGW